MENIIVPAVVSQSFSDHSDNVDVVPTEGVEAKRVVRQTKISTKPAEEKVPQPNILEIQSWLSTKYGDPVEIYDETPTSKQEEHYTVVVTGDVPEIYQVSISEVP